MEGKKDVDDVYCYEYKSLINNDTMQHVGDDLHQVQEQLSMWGGHEAEVEQMTDWPDEPVDSDQVQQPRLT